MNHTVNIKEMLSMPAAGSRSGAANGATNFTDSQFFFGSQFWRENSQGLSQEMSLSSRNSQQSSTEGSDPKFLTSYRSKPLLFGDPKDKHKAFGLLDTFEEEKKKAKEKNDSQMLAKECLHIRETLNKIQQLMNEAVSTELGSNMQSDVEHLRKEHEKTRLNHESMLEEALRLLNTLVSEHSAKLCPGKVTDTAMQTSPGQDEGIEVAQDSHISHKQRPAAVVRIGKSTSRVSRKRKKERAPVPPQRSNLTVYDENSQPLINGIKQQNRSRPLCSASDVNQVSSRSSFQPNTKGRSTEAAGCFITPLSFWSQESNNSDILKCVSPNLEKASTESNAGAAMPPDALWRLFDMD
uniref:interactor of HORMAD1 protein 1 isoform X2 n=1 Tax=Doryrhamphus excisus TaxID=161450 RepID=UPI0025AE6F79|nr:interactor of HORMAD1 protein 1 isoform X2 [Doryrhamphus excisus]